MSADPIKPTGPSIKQLAVMGERISHMPWHYVLFFALLPNAMVGARIWLGRKMNR